MIGLMKTKTVFGGLFLLAGIEALGALIFLLLLPADPKNAVLWGYSTARLVMAAGMLVATIACVYAGRFAGRNNDYVERGMGWLSEKPTRPWGAGSFLAVMAIITWTAVWLPAYRFGSNQLLYERLFPLLVWVGLSCGQWLLALLIWRDILNVGRFWRVVQSERRLWWFVAGGLSLFALVQVAANRLAFLTAHDAMQYNPPGAPVLPLQILAGCFAGIIALVVTGSLKRDLAQTRKKRLWEKNDWGIFVAIWAVAAVIWIVTPMQPTFFAPVQRPPDGVLFPYSDAALYDRSAQFALMGLDMRNGAYVDKPLYSAFLTVLHLIGGQNYDLITAIQAGIFALLPALTYTLGKRLHSRAAGIAGAVLVLSRGANAIAGGHWIQTAHSRLLLSEMPTALVLAFLVYFLVRWFANPRESLYSVLAGGALGLSTLIRHNPWFLVPVIVLTAGFVYWRNWKRWFVQVGLFGLAMFLVISPWMYYSQKTVGTPWYFMIPLRGVVWKGRLQPEIEEGSFSPSEEGDVLALSAKSSAMGGILFMQSGRVLPEGGQLATGVPRILQVMSAHYYNNLRGSLLILPETWIADDLDHALTAPESAWQGGWTDGNSVLMVVNVCLILIGIGVSWKKWHIAGITPFIVFIGYLAALSIARTSGGRYLVPVDWVVLLYYAVGVIQVITWIIKRLPNDGQDERLHDNISTTGQWATGLLGLVLVTGMIPFVQEALPRSLPSKDEATMPAGEWMEAAGLDLAEIMEFLEGDGAVVRYGKAIYPRFYNWKDGESLGCFGARPYPRVVFELIGEDGTQCVTLPYANLNYDVQLHYSTAIILGCEGGGDWVAMFPEHDLALVRFTQVDPPTCPLSYPICADNRNCH
jgi:hypothetical protein